MRNECLKGASRFRHCVNLLQTSLESKEPQVTDSVVVDGVKMTQAPIVNNVELSHRKYVAAKAYSSPTEDKLAIHHEASVRVEEMWGMYDM